ncbi:MAG: hypothetical protein ACO3YY_12010 [Phycisphaerales bacterium]|jgi:hypothetical protein
MQNLQSRRSVRPTSLPGTAGVVVAMLLATCAVVAAEAEWRQREHRAREDHASSLVLGHLSACLAFVDRGAERVSAGDAPGRRIRLDDDVRPRSGDDGFGGALEAVRLRRLLNTPPPRV